MTVILLGIGVYAAFSYVGEIADDYNIVGRYWFLMSRIAVSFVAVGLVVGWSKWYFGFAALGISRLCSRLDNYITVVARSIAAQRRR